MQQDNNFITVLHDAFNKQYLKINKDHIVSIRIFEEHGSTTYEYKLSNGETVKSMIDIFENNV